MKFELNTLEDSTVLSIVEFSLLEDSTVLLLLRIQRLEMQGEFLGLEN